MMLVPSIFGENLFDDFMNFPFDDPFFSRKSDRPARPTRSIMKTDVRELEDSYELDIDLPGYAKEDVNLQLKDGYLTVSAAKNENKDVKDENGKYIRRERYSGNMSRAFYVGNAVSAEDVHAKFENGILKLSVPKKDPNAVEAKHTIAIEG